MATKREEYIAKLKTQLDQWNAEMAKWEARPHRRRRACARSTRGSSPRSTSIRTKPRNSCARCRRPRATRGWSSLAARTRPGRRCARPSRRPTRSSGSREAPAEKPRRLAPEHRVEVLDVVDEDPLGGPGLLDPLLPGLEPPHVAPRIDVVGLELDDVERHDPDVLQVDGEIADRDLVELLLHVGEDEDGLLSRSGLVQKHPALDQAAGDVGVGAASHRLDEGVDLVAEGALLRVRLRGAAVESDFRDDVLLAEAARFHPRHGERIPRLQRAEQVVDDALCLADLLRVRS